MFCYELNAPRASFPIDVNRMDGTKAYMRHYDNWLFLNFMIENGNFQERAQAQAELKVCERKMKFWTHHHNYDAARVLELKEKRLNEWKRGGRPSNVVVTTPRPAAVVKPKPKPRVSAKPAYEPDF